MVRMQNRTAGVSEVGCLLVGCCCAMGVGFPKLADLSLRIYSLAAVAVCGCQRIHIVARNEDFGGHVPILYGYVMRCQS